ncbi:uncharacterized protein LOC128204908 [Mya arenaria]|uniref:uncharacterized protein LOC128204908 n=1 Tax=Mya arenaria TaxID=6604 RepID=UPI0022E531F7|nr:uncharacterized protein LOC128204908 [Mya arenaria]
MKWYNMCLLTSFVLCFCLVSTEGRGLKLRKSQVEVDEFQPLTLICDLVKPYPIDMIDWISNGKTEFSMEEHCLTQIDSTKGYNISCLSYRQYNLTINNVTRMNHGDIWYCREDHYLNAQSNNVEIQVEVPISNISLFTEKQFVTVSENESALVQCVSHGGIPAGQITWFYDKGTPDDASDDVILTEMKNETITQLDNTVTTRSYVDLKANTELIGTSLNCKATNDKVDWLLSNGTLIAVLLLPSSVEISHPRTQFVTAYKEKSVYFECVTSPGYPASSITWYKLTNGSEVIISADGSLTTEKKDRTIVTRSWVSLIFSISDDWTSVYCTANNFAGTLTSKTRADVHVHQVSGWRKSLMNL